MKISEKNINKLLESIFCDEYAVIEINDFNDRDLYIVDFEKKLKKLSTKMKISTSISSSGLRNERMSKKINIQFRDLDFYDYFVIFFNNSNELCFKYKNQFFYDGNLEKLSLFFEKLDVEYEKNLFEINKKEKIKSLKIKAIEANIAELSKTDNFDFFINHSTIKLNLHIKISNRNELIIHIPFNKFQETLNNVRSIIKTIRDLDVIGVQFKIKGHSNISWRKG